MNHLQERIENVHMERPCHHRPFTIRHSPFTIRFLAGAVLSCIAVSAAFAADAWKSFTKENTPGLPGNEIQCLVPARDGGVWAGTLNGATRVAQGVFSPLKDDKGKPFALGVWAVLDTAAGPWFGADDGIIDSRGGRFAPALQGYKVAPIVGDAAGGVWALGRDPSDTATLFQLRGNDWTAVTNKLLRRIVDLYRTPNGRLWVTLDGNGALEIDPAAGVDKAVHHLRSISVTAVREDSKGAIWFGLWGGGVAIWDGKEMKRELTQVRESAILSMAEDGAGNIWLATSANGLWYRPLAGGPWKQELADQGAVNTMAATRDGRIWISGQNLPGLRYWNGKAWVVSLDSPLPIRVLVEAADGSLWAGGTLDGLYFLRK